MSPRNSSSPHQFIHECQVPGRVRSSALIPVNGEQGTAKAGVQSGSALALEGKVEVTVQQQALTPRPPPMSHPLFAGWGDAGLFAALLAKDVARLQRRLGDIRRSRTAGATAVGRKDLADPMACVRTLATMLLQPVADICKQRPQNSKPAGSRRSGLEAEDPWRGLCTELAERAAHLEVLLGVLAEVMVVQLMCVTPVAGSGSAAVADSAGCPSTRIGWVDEAIGALESLSDRSTGPVPDRVEMQRQGGLKGIEEVTCRSVSVQTASAAQPLAIDVTTQTDSEQEAGVGASGLDRIVLQIEGVTQGIQTELAVCDATTMTEPLEVIPEAAPTRSFLLDAGTQVGPTLSTASVQASSSTSEASMQASVDSQAVDTQTTSTTCVESAAQTEPIAAPKAGGLREKKLNADDAIQQLAGAREKLKLEREAAVALEAKLSAAGRTITELQRERQALRATAAASAEAAAAAAWRPTTIEAAVQQSQDVKETEMQTDPAVFYTHSWQTRADLEPSKPSRTDAFSGIDAVVQTPLPPSTKSSSTQTWRSKQALRDACVGGEEPLRLALGHADLPESCPNEPWRGQYSQGMQALVEQWQTRWQVAEAERKRLEALLESAAGNIGSASG